ncbi:hypothetical protein M405DRAFT_785777 [Rhizopogon salebrosus TDB-379]|nr:hypothetical protein M405DRAFT_785777 [Rhizopogon salebrosus TDB-379]
MSISELRWKIFELIWASESMRKKTLLALALTCKSFTGPALDLLWRELDGLDPLIRCLPPSLWKIDKQELKFQRVMTLDDWSIFRKYSCRVSSLEMTYAPRAIRVGTDIWGALDCPPFPLPLLPNLTTLRWDAPDEAFPCIRSFVTQTLTTLIISTYYTTFSFGPCVQPILSCIPALCPSVSHVEFHGDEESGDEESGDAESGDASIALQSWSHLISVRTGSVSNAAILHLSNLPSLRKLYVGLCSTPIDADAQNLLRHPAFPALHTLDVRCNTLAPLDTFFDTFSLAPKILCIRVIDGWHSTEHLPASMSRISNACAHSALEHLEIVDDEFGINFDASIGAAVFQPIYAFRNLRIFHFEVEPDVLLHDGTLMQMAEAWPLLEDLAILGALSTSSHQHVTPNGLVSLLQRCPRLSSIRISMDWSAVDRPDVSPNIPYGGFAHKALTCADFGSSKIRQAVGVAAFMSAIAPKLRTITGWDSESHYEHDDYKIYSSRWKAVDDLVKAFSMVRAQERRMMLGAIRRGFVRR